MSMSPKRPPRLTALYAFFIAALISGCSPGGSTDSADAAPTLSVASVSVVEGDQGTMTASTVVTLSQAVDELVTANYRTVDATAIAGLDYQPAEGTLEFQVGETSKQVMVSIVGDLENEGAEERFMLEVFNTNGPVLLGDATADIVINDNDGNQQNAVTPLVVDAQPTLESEGLLELRFVLEAPTTTGVTFSVRSLNSGSANAGEDFFPLDQVVFIPAGSSEATVVLATIDDDLHELNETIDFQINDLQGASFSGPFQAVVLDDEVQPTLSVADAEVIEGDNGNVALTFQASLSQASALDVSVSYATVAVTASAANDFEPESQTLVIPAGEQSGQIVVTIAGDTAVESNEGLLLQLQNSVNAELINASALGVIINDDLGNTNLPTIEFDDLVVTEGGGVQGVIQLSSPAQADIGVSLDTIDASARAGSDYSATRETISIPAGAVSQSFSFATIDDDLAEQDEQFFIRLDDVQGPANLGDSLITVRIEDNDELPTLEVTDATVEEGTDNNSNLMVSFTLNKVSSVDIPINFRTRPGSAQAGSDYISNSGVLLLPAGQLSISASIFIIGDTLDELDESFQYELLESSGVTRGRSLGTITINDDDEAPLPSLSITDTVSSEGGDGLTFQLSLDNVATQSVSVRYRTESNSAVAGSDFIASTAQVTIPAGMTSVNLMVSVIDDANSEETESFRVILEEPSGASISDSFAIGTIIDNDRAPSVIDLTIADALVSEGDANEISHLIFNVVLAEIATQNIQVDYAIQAGSASSNLDYTDTAGTLVIQLGSDRGAITIDVLGDTIEEQAENLTLLLSNPVGVNVLRSEANGVIQDNDGASSLAVSPTAVVEGNTGTASLNFDLTLSRPSSATVSVSYATTNGSAIAGEDYTAVTGLASIAAGRTSTTISVPVIADLLDEDDESISLILTNPNNATLAVGSATGVIRDDDIAPTINIEDVQVQEDVGTTALNLSLSAPSGKAIEVRFASQSGTAATGSDFVRSSGTITFNPGQVSKDITVEILDDTNSESTETFFIGLSAATNGLIESSTSTITIIDDDSASVVSVRLTWSPPSTNADGSILSDLAGYRIYQGPNTDGLTQVNSLLVQGGAGSAQSTTIADVTNSNRCFAVSAFDENGNEGDRTPTQCWNF